MAAYKRRQFIVAVPFQSRFIAFRVILLTILALALWILVFYPLQLEMISDIVNGPGGMTDSGLPIPNIRVLLGIVAIFLFTHVVPVINELATQFEAAAKAERLLRETLAPPLDESQRLCGQDGVPEQVRARVEELRTQVRQAI